MFKIDKNIPVPESLISKPIRYSQRSYALMTMSILKVGESFLVEGRWAFKKGIPNNKLADIINLSTVESWIKKWHLDNNITIPYKRWDYKTKQYETRYRVDPNNIKFVCKSYGDMQGYWNYYKSIRIWRIK